MSSAAEYPPQNSALRLVTTVVLATTNGAVPVVTSLSKVCARISKLPASQLSDRATVPFARRAPDRDVKNALASFPSSRSAFRFVTTVVLATTIGAVPVATSDSNVCARTSNEPASQLSVRGIVPSARSTPLPPPISSAAVMPPTNSTLRFVTMVSDATTIGAVPVVTVLVSWSASVTPPVK